MGFISDIADRGKAEILRWAGGSDEDVPLDTMMKALEGTGLAEPTEETPRAMFHDPYSIQDWGGWRQRPSSLTYESLRQMAVQNTVIASIIQLRTHQVSQFCRPQQGVYDRGYRVILRDRRDNKRSMTKQEQKLASSIEAMLETTGLLLDGERPSDRDSFRSFMRKSTRDILTYDQWCALPGTMITMSDGTEKPIEAVRPGDNVLTHSGRVRPVVEAMCRPYTGTMHRFVYRGGSVAFTSKHPSFIAEKNEQPTWVEAAAVRAGQYATYPVPQRRPTPLPVVAPWGECSSEDAYIVGLYVAEGFSVGVESRFSLSEWDVVQRVVQWAAAKDWRCVVTEDGENAWLVRLTGNKQASAWLRDSCGDGAVNKRVPPGVLLAEREAQCAFLRGVLDGDGHWKGAVVVLSTTAPALLSGLRALSGMLGWYLTWSETGNAARGWLRCWQACFSGEAFRAAMATAGTQVDAPTQEGRARIQCVEGTYRLPISRTESFEVADQLVYNLEVEDDHSYIANGIATHNCYEKIRDKAGRVSRFVCLPAETIRPAVVDFEHMAAEQMRDRVAYVQVYDNTIISEFGVDDLAWNIMNPRSDLRANGFGFAPTEQIIRLVTAWLYGFSYNQKFFTQGSAVKGVLNIKGSIPDRQLRAFRRMWYSMVSGVQNAWRTPILNSEDIQWISMHTNNRDMEFSAWMDWLTKMTCAVYGIDPVEINFIFGNTGQSQSLGQSRPNADELTESKDKGLRPLTDFITDSINQHIVWEAAPELEFTFAGLDAKAEGKERERRTTEVKSYRTVDEIRAEMDLDPLPDDLGAAILDPTWLQFANNKQMMEQQAQGGQPGAPGVAGDDGEGGPPGEEVPPGGDQGGDGIPEMRLSRDLADAASTLERLRKGTRSETIESGKRTIELDF